jgi:hypothetical protein
MRRGWVNIRVNRPAQWLLFVVAAPSPAMPLAVHGGPGSEFLVLALGFASQFLVPASWFWFVVPGSLVPVVVRWFVVPWFVGSPFVGSPSWFAVRWFRRGSLVRWSLFPVLVLSLFFSLFLSLFSRCSSLPGSWFLVLIIIPIL